MKVLSVPHYMMARGRSECRAVVAASKAITDLFRTKTENVRVVAGRRGPNGAASPLFGAMAPSLLAN